jgi:N-ethylmaleimide reductase
MTSKSTPNDRILLRPFTFGSLELPNRIVMAPLTRMRALHPLGIPNELMRDYYVQRASAGLIITEGTFVSDQARGWFGAPGVYTDAQRKGWQAITDEVHRAGGRIIVQLWHQGSVSNRDLVGNGRSPLGPSAVDPEQQVYTGYGKTEVTLTPAAMTREDILQTVLDFRHTARVARDAGFDGVQLQGGFVYLFQQFLQENLNLRTDEYGGSIENRARLLFEVLEAVIEEWPSQSVGVKAGPMMSERGGFRSLPSTLTAADYIYGRLNDYDLSHVMVMRQLADLTGTPLEALSGDAIIHHARNIYKGTIMLNVGLEAARAEELLESGLGELVAFGRDYIANPDLVERIRANAPLNPQHPETFYGPDGKGYTDYPTLQKVDAPTEEVAHV